MSKAEVLDNVMKMGGQPAMDGELIINKNEATGMGEGSEGMMDKMLMMKMLGGESQGKGGDMKEMMMMMMMIKAMNAPAQTQGGMDPLMMVMMMGMGGKDKGMGMHEMKEMMEIMGPKKGDGDDATLAMMSKLMESQENGRENDLKAEIAELKNLVFASLQGGGGESQSKDPVAVMEDSLGMVEKVKSVMQERDLIGPRSEGELDREKRNMEFQMQRDMSTAEIVDRRDERHDLKEVLRDVSDKLDAKLTMALEFMTKEQRARLVEEHPEFKVPLYEPTRQDMSSVSAGDGKKETISDDLDDIA